VDHSSVSKHHLGGWAPPSHHQVSHEV
jgi:hypothetical protein